MELSCSTTQGESLAPRAIVLVAGAGARMLPLTQNEHKSLLPMGNTTILGRIVDSLLAINVHEIVIVTGYLADRVEQFLTSRYPAEHFHFVRNDRYAETNNIVSLAMALESISLDRDVILIECDLLFKPELLKRLTSASGNVALVDRYRTGMDGTVVTVMGGLVTQVYPTHLQTEGFDYSDKYKTLNIYRFDGQFCQAIFKPLLSCYANIIDSGCYYELVLGMLVNMQHQIVRAEIVEGTEWAEVDDPNDLASARFIFEPEERTHILKETWGGHWNFDIVDFSFMRNMHFPTDAMIASTRRALPELMHSYGSAQGTLNSKLAVALKCNVARIQCLNGAAQIYPELVTLLPQGGALLPTPTFGEYGRWFPHHDTYVDTPGIDLAALSKRINGNAVAVFVNPNNPTGTVLETEAIYALAESHPKTMFVVDESFLGFSDEISIIRLLEQQPLPNVVVITSLSKTLGVPGLRLGYVYSCNLTFIEQLGGRLPIWNVNSIAEYYLELLPKFRLELKTSLARTKEDRFQMFHALQALDGVETVYPSGGNFLLVRLVKELVSLRSEIVEISIQRYGMYLKDVSGKFSGGDAWFRFAVRKPTENQLLVSMLSAIFAELMEERN